MDVGGLPLCFCTGEPGSVSTVRDHFVMNHMIIMLAPLPITITTHLVSWNSEPLSAKGLLTKEPVSMAASMPTDNSTF